MDITKIALFFLVTFVFSARAATALQFGGQGYVSQNQTQLLTPASGFNIGFFGTQDISNPRSMIDGFAQEILSPSNFTNLQLLSGNGSDLAVGSYLDATWFEIGHPGIIFSTSSRGFNDTTAWFTILELQWGANNRPSVLAVDFYLKENIPNTDWVLGSLRYNSDIPLGPVPEPGTATLLALPLLGLTRRRR